MCHQNGTFLLLFSNGQKFSWIHIFGIIIITLFLVQDLASTPTIHEIHSLPLDKKSCCQQDNGSSCHQDNGSSSRQDIRSTDSTQLTTRVTNTPEDNKYDHRNISAISMTQSKENFVKAFRTHLLDKRRKDSDEIKLNKSQVYNPFDRGIKVKATFGHEGEGLRTRVKRQVFKGGNHRPVFIQPEDNFPEVPVNAKAFLNCRVGNLGKYTVSWIRQSDLQILSVGNRMFTTDKRMSLTYQPRNQNYRLEIRQVRKEDFGSYECQINTKPMQTIVVHLAQKSIPFLPTHKTVPATRKPIEVNELGEAIEAIDPPQMSGAKTHILGGPDIYVHPNSLVNITCVVLASSKPKYIFWNHEGQGLTYRSREGVSIVIEDKGQTIVSQLLIKAITPADQGTYQCKPENHLAAEARVFIIEDAVSDATRVNSGTVFPPWPKLYALLILVVSRRQFSNGS